MTKEFINNYTVEYVLEGRGWYRTDTLIDYISFMLKSEPCDIDMDMTTPPRFTLKLAIKIEHMDRKVFYKRLDTISRFLEKEKIKEDTIIIPQ